MVTYDTTYPVINKVTMGQWTGDNVVGHVVSYNPLEGVATFPYVYVPNWNTYFIIEFNNSNRVEFDSVVVRCSNGKTLRAEYRQDTNDFYASGRTDGSNKNYMPGSITIDYGVLPELWSVPSEIPTIDDVRSSLPGALMDAEVTVDDNGVYEPDENGVYTSPIVTIKSSDTSGVNFELEGWITIKPLASYPPPLPPGSTGIFIGRNSSSGSMDVYNFNYSITKQEGVTVISGGFTVPIEAVDNSALAQMGIQSLSSVTRGLEFGFNVIDKLNTYGGGAKSIFSAPSMFDELEGLRDYVDRYCNSSASELYYQLLDIEAEGMMSDLAVTSAMTVVGTAITATGFGLAVGVSTLIAGSLFNWIVSKNRQNKVQELREKIMNDDRCSDEDDDDDDDDYDDDDQDRRTKRVSTRVSDHEYILDPSGYVYEAVPENRIGGVKATLFEYNAAQGIWEVWDSEYYGQENPLYTDAQGRYAWDVPEGDWRVTYEKDGYETATSWEMHVPPPHTDVNVGLISFVPPSVTSVTAAGGGEYIEIVFDKYMKTDTIGDRTMQVQKEGAVDEDDNPMFTVGDIVPVDPYKPDPNDSETIARVFRFVPDHPLDVNERYNVWISGVVRSYAGSIMGEDYTGTLTIPEKDIPVTGVTLNRTSLTLYPGESSRLTATVLPADATNKSVTWQSGNPSVADVDNTGLVSSYTTGTAIITVTTTDGGYTATCTVNVIPRPVDDGGDDDSGYYYQYVPVTGITLDKTELSLIVGGEPVVLNATVLPPNATNKNIIWSSSDQNVAIVQNGTVTPVGAGTAIITAKTSSGGFTATCTVTVKAAAEVFSGKAGVNAAVLEAFDGDISLIFETATFLADTDVTIERFESDGVPDGYICGSSVFNITFGGKELRKPVTLIIRYDQQAADNTNPLKFALYRWDEDSSSWVYAGGAVSTDDGTVTAEIEAPGRYMIMAYDRTFSDISNHWSRNEVEILASRHVIAGYTNNEFRPENRITRAEFVKLVMSMVPYCPYVEAARSKMTGVYDDVTSDKWYFPYVEAATELGIVTGSGGSFRPEDPITREEMAIILIRIFNTPAEMEQAAKEFTAPFRDSDEISDWALGAVVLANQKGIIKGDASGNFRPKDYAKRAEAAAVILRTMENLGFIKAPVSLKGTLRVMEIEGTHFELEVPCTCPSGKTYYVIIPADCIIEKQLRLFIDKEVPITGILLDEPNIYMRGPVLKAISIGDRIRTACAKCSQ